MATRTKINWLQLEALIRQQLINAREGADPRGCLLQIDLIMGDHTGRGYVIEGAAAAEWLEGGE